MRSPQSSTTALLVLAAVTALLVVLALRPPPVVEVSAAQPALDAGTTATATAGPEFVVGAWSIDDAQAALDGGEPVVVLGDSTSNDSNEWVELWADELGFEVSTWVDGYDEDDARVLNASIPGADAADAINGLDDFVPAEPGLVILNFGHNQSTANAGQIGALHDALAERIPDTPVVVILQQPELEDANAAVRAEIAEDARARELPVIDIAAAFADDDRATEELLYDELHPNDDGSRLWADTVLEILR